MTEETSIRFQAKLGSFLVPLYPPSHIEGLHYIDAWDGWGKNNLNYVVFNLVEEWLDWQTTELPLTDIKLWHLSEDNRGLRQMRSMAWSSDVEWFFFFTPERT